MIRLVSLVLVFAASFGAVYWAMSPRDPVEAAPETVGSVAPAATQSSEVTVRNVTPDTMTAAPPPTGPLVRVEPVIPPKPPSPARTERVFNALVLSAGALKVGDREITIAGISATPPDASCGDGNAAWPCGRMARAALRSFIRGRAIDCDVPEGTDAIPEQARCRVGDEDIAEWLVAQGWAKRSGDAYEGAEKAARDDRLGLFSEIRPDAQPGETVAGR